MGNDPADPEAFAAMRSASELLSAEPLDQVEDLLDYGE
jgi:hypothetical protein